MNSYTLKPLLHIWTVSFPPNWHYGSRTVSSKRVYGLNTRVDTLNMFSKLSDVDRSRTKQAVPISIVLPAFITSELKTAFEIGFFDFFTVFSD